VIDRIKPKKGTHQSNIPLSLREPDGLASRTGEGTEGKFFKILIKKGWG